MAGRGTAPNNGRDLEDEVARIAKSLGLRVRPQVEVARRIWGARRRIDMVLTDPSTRKMLGLECKFQGVGGTAEEKLPGTVQDIAAWPIPGLVVFAGAGFTENMKAFLHSTGKAVELEDLEPWLRLFFGMDEA